MDMLRVLGPNMTEVDKGDAVVFFSYNTPVAAFVPGNGYIKTAEKFSVTTSRHVNRWLGNEQFGTQISATTLPAEEFKAMLDSL